MQVDRQAALAVAFGAFLLMAAAPGAVLYTGDGTLGSARIGMVLVMQGDHVSTPSHYYYQKYLKDIPLTGSAADGFVLHEPGGGIFTLRFKGNGSENGKPLTYDNSIGLTGSWSADGRTVPVELGMSSIDGGMPARWYGNVDNIGGQSDMQFEARIQGFQHAVLSGDRAATARCVSFPLRVNWSPTRHRSIATPAALSANWDAIFTPGWRDAAAKAMPRDLPVIRSQAMLGLGLAFIDGNGVTAINVPTPWSQTSGR